MQEELQWYGIDWDGPIGPVDDADPVFVPPTNNPLSPFAHEMLLRHVDPSSDDIDPELMYIGIRLFVHTLV